MKKSESMSVRVILKTLNSTLRTQTLDAVAGKDGKVLLFKKIQQQICT